MELRSRKGSSLFIILQLLMYITFLYLDITGINAAISSYIKFTAIILCFCYALFVKKSADKSILFLMKVALFFTVISDLLILILDVYFYGILTFIIVQQIYGLRISIEKYDLQGEANSNIIWSSFLRRLLLQLVISFIVVLILAYSGMKPESLLIASTFYFINLVTNTFTAVKTAISSPDCKSIRIFALGMLLFLCCDINVGLFNATGFIDLSLSTYSVIYEISSILMWTFYAPSQVILALSVGGCRK